MMQILKRIFSKPTTTQTKPSNAYTYIGGQTTVAAIAHHFYKNMQSDPQLEKLLMVHKMPLDIAEQRLFEFLSGWLGGPPLFEQQYGHPMLRKRHLHVAIDEELRDQWLCCMDYALAQSVTDSEHRQVIRDAIAKLADHMRNQ